MIFDSKFRLQTRLRKTEPAWMEPVRLMSVPVWVFLLTVLAWYQVYHLLTGWAIDAIAQRAASMILAGPIWTAIYFHAVAISLGWYLFTHLYAPPKSDPISVGQDRMARMLAISAFSIGAFSYAICVRILVFLPMVTMSDDLAALDPYRFYKLSPSEDIHMQYLRVFALTGLLAAGLVIFQGWGIVRRLGGSRARFMTLAGVVLVIGVIIPVTGTLNGYLYGVDRVDLSDPVLRGLLLNDPDHAEVAKKKLFVRLATHDDQGVFVPAEVVRRNRSREWRELDHESWKAKMCELCQLPGVAYWILNGLAVRLSEEEPDSPEPDLVLEFPRGGDTFRVYPPITGSKPTVFPIEDLGDKVRGTDYLILKIDVLIQMPVVMQHLSTLRDAGVRRADLAVTPTGFTNLGEVIPLLRWESPPKLEPYKPPEFQRKYVPPPPRIYQKGPRIGCEDLSSRERIARGWISRPETVNSLPKAISIYVESEYSIDRAGSFGLFAQNLAGAIHGGANEVRIHAREASNGR